MQDLTAAVESSFEVAPQDAEVSKKIEQVHADDRRAVANLARAAAGGSNKPANQSNGRPSAGKPQRYTFLNPNPSPCQPPPLATLQSFLNGNQDVANDFHEQQSFWGQLQLVPEHTPLRAS